MTEPARPAVVFDFDGVLADTERLHLAAFQAVLAAHDWTLAEHDYFDRYLGYTDHDLLAAFGNDRGLALDERLRATLVDEKARRFADRLERGDVLFAGAEACITRLGRTFRLAIASGSPRNEIVAILSTARLVEPFEVIVGADDVARSKPAADPYREAIRRLGLGPHEAVAVEDSRWGLTSAEAAGLTTIALTTSYPAEALGRADAVVGSLDEIDEALVQRVLGIGESGDRTIG